MKMFFAGVFAILSLHHTSACLILIGLYETYEEPLLNFYSAPFQVSVKSVDLTPVISALRSVTQNRDIGFGLGHES